MPETTVTAEKKEEITANVTQETVTTASDQIQEGSGINTKKNLNIAQENHQKTLSSMNGIFKKIVSKKNILKILDEWSATKISELFEQLRQLIKIESGEKPEESLDEYDEYEYDEYEYDEYEYDEDEYDEDEDDEDEYDEDEDDEDEDDEDEDDEDEYDEDEYDEDEYDDYDDILDEGDDDDAEVLDEDKNQLSEEEKEIIDSGHGYYELLEEEKDVLSEDDDEDEDEEKEIIDSGYGYYELLEEEKDVLSEDDDEYEYDEDEDEEKEIIDSGHGYYELLEKEKEKKDLILKKCEILEKIILQLRELNSDISQQGFGERNGDKAAFGNLDVALNKFINVLTSYYNFIATPIHKPHLMDTTAANMLTDDEDENDSRDETLNFERINKISIGEYDDVSNFYKLTAREWAELDEFFRENGVLENAYNNLAKEIKQREDIKEKLRNDEIFPSESAKYNERIIKALNISEKLYDPSNIFSESQIPELEKSLKNMQKMISKRKSLFTIISKNSLSEGESNYLSMLESTLKSSLNRLKSIRSYDAEDLENIREIIGKTIKNPKSEEEYAYDLRSARNYIMEIEDVVSPFLYDILSKKSNDEPLLFEIISDDENIREEALNVTEYFANLLHTSEDEKKYKFLNHEHINGVIMYIEALEADEEKTNSQMLDARLEKRSLYINMALQDNRLKNKALARTYKELDEARQYAGRTIDITESMPGLGERNSDEEPIDAEKKIGEQKNGNRNFGKDQCTCAKMVAHICGAISAGQKDQEKFNSYLYGYNTKLKQFCDLFNEIVEDEKGLLRNKLPGALSQFISLLKDFHKTLAEGIPSSGTPPELKEAKEFANELRTYIANGGYKRSKDLLTSIKDLIEKSGNNSKKIEDYMAGDDAYLKLHPTITLKLKFADDTQKKK